MRTPHPSSITDAEVPNDGLVAYTKIMDHMDWLDGMYGPTTVDEYIATCEALKAELDARIKNAKETLHGV